MPDLVTGIIIGVVGCLFVLMIGAVSLALPELLHDWVIGLIDRQLDVRGVLMTQPPPEGRGPRRLSIQQQLRYILDHEEGKIPHKR